MTTTTVMKQAESKEMLPIGQRLAAILAASSESHALGTELLERLDAPIDNSEWRRRHVTRALVIRLSLLSDAIYTLSKLDPEDVDAKNAADALRVIEGPRYEHG